GLAAGAAARFHHPDHGDEGQSRRARAHRAVVGGAGRRGVQLLFPCCNRPRRGHVRSCPRGIRGCARRSRALAAAVSRADDGALGGKCGACEYRKLCGGCRARAFALEGDVLAADPSCVYEPKGVAVIEAAHDVLYGQDFIPALAWSPSARARLERIPSFVRGVVTKRVEDWARERGIHEVTPELLSEIRKSMP